MTGKEFIKFLRTRKALHKNIIFGVIVADSDKEDESFVVHQLEVVNFGNDHKNNFLIGFKEVDDDE